MGETTDNRANNQEGQSFTAREFELIQELVRSRMEKNEELQYESFEGYELPPRTQFSMLKKPAVSIKYGQLTFNMAAIRLFEGVKHVLTVVNTEKKETGCCTLCRGRKCICRMGQSQQTGQMGE